MKAILYIAHGTRSKKGALEASYFLQKVISKVPVPIQEYSFLELTDPPIDEGFLRCVERGATEVTIVPIFLLAAGHIKKDIPLILDSLRKKYPTIKINMMNAFGVQEEILDAISELVKSTVKDLTFEDSILIVGRGSSDPGIHQAFSDIEKGIRQRLGVEHVSSSYLAATVPTFHDGLESMLSKTSKRVIVVPYLLFSGLLLSEVILWCKKLGPHVIPIDPLSRHSAMERIVIQNAMRGVLVDAATNR